MTQTKPVWLPEVQAFRRQLHQHPELSGAEEQTALRVLEKLERLQPSQIFTGLGGHGVAAVFDSGRPGPTLLFRTELDALPIEEVNEFAYRSTNPGVSHKCGHDGHMAVMMGFAHYLQGHPPGKGRVLLLFQPAEEIGAGAQWMLDDPGFDALLPIDHAFAFHNLPGFPSGQIVCREGPFSAAVQSLIVRLHGKTAHAGEPENGTNPAMAISEIIKASQTACQPDRDKEGFAILTPVHINLGEVAYGVSAGYGEIHLTIRTWTEAEMEKLSQRLLDYIGRVSKKYGLKAETEWTNIFRTNRNDPEMAALIEAAAEAEGFSYHTAPYAFKWGEDFGAFTQQYRGAMFGIGSGEGHPALHNPDYDFPDEIIPVGVRMYTRLCEAILNH